MPFKRKKKKIRIYRCHPVLVTPCSYTTQTGSCSKHKCRSRIQAGHNLKNRENSTLWIAGFLTAELQASARTWKFLKEVKKGLQIPLWINLIFFCNFFWSNKSGPRSGNQCINGTYTQDLKGKDKKIRSNKREEKWKKNIEHFLSTVLYCMS